MSRIVVPFFLDAPSPAARQMVRADDNVLTATPATSGARIERVAPVHEAIADAIAAVIDTGARPTAILGDCCQTIGVVAGLTRKGLTPSLVWIDAHGDFNTTETSPSGFLGGMPLAMLTGRGDQRMMQAVGLVPIADARVVLAGARDLDPGERDLVSKSGISEVLDLNKLVAALPDGPLYLHFDSDVLDSRLAPAFLYPAPGGPTPEAARVLLAAILATGRVIAVSVTVGWDVKGDTDGTTLRAVKAATSGLLA